MTDDRLVRPCCGASAPDFDRATGWVLLPHKKSCPYYRDRVKETSVR